MKFGRIKIIPVFIVVLLLLFSDITLIVNADELKVGSVKGLPEKLVVLDDNGQSVSENGEYYFHVENMKVAETYSKRIQIMNLREDATYQITFQALPLTNEGNIDLENECRCTIYLDDKMVYYGKVTGDGEPNITDSPLSLGFYDPGESHILTVYVRWNGTNGKGHVDYGARLVDKSGTAVIREKSGKAEIEGETTFKWIFFAEVKKSNADESKTTISEVSPDESDLPGPESDTDFSGGGSANQESPETSPGTPVKPRHDDPNNPIATGETIAYIAIGVIMTATLLLAILVLGRKKKKEKKKSSNKSDKKQIKMKNKRS